MACRGERSSSKGQSGKAHAAKTPPKQPLPKTPPDAVAGSVIVRTHRSGGKMSSSVRVQCAFNTERLVGGGCSGQERMNGRPFAFSPRDTIGAGWTCKAGPSTSGTLVAYALCQVVDRRPPAKEPAPKNKPSKARRKRS